MIDKAKVEGGTKLLLWWTDSFSLQSQERMVWRLTGKKKRRGVKLKKYIFSTCRACDCYG